MVHVFERLLLATEHTPQDTGAEYLAMALARRCGMPLSVVLPLLSNAEYESVAPELAARRDGMARSHLDELRVRAEGMGVTLQPRARHGTALDQEILAEAQDRHADLLILRRRGRRSLLARLLLGEMVGRVIARSPCSVLIAPLGARVWQQRVLVALDPLQDDEALLTTALTLASECRLPLTTVCVLDSAQAGLRGAADALLARAAMQAGPMDVAIKTTCLTGRAGEQVLAAARECQADLVIVGRRGGAAGSRPGLGSVMQTVAGHAECPVLIHVAPCTEAAPPSHPPSDLP